MIDEIEVYYQRLAAALAEPLAEDWATVWVEAVFYSDGSEYSAEYVSADGGPAKSIETPTAVERAFVERRDLFKAAGKPLWCRARFELHATGKFKMDWGYDGCDENGYARFGAEEELRRRREERTRR